MTAPEGIERVVLVGFMGAGKSTVGPRLALALGWSFHDLDAVVEAEEGRTIGAIFSDSGEPYFREVEDRVARRHLELPRVVLAMGGGWAAVPGRLEALPPGTVSVWLKVDPEEAVRRAGGGGTRPLLSGPEPVEVARALLRQRASRYAASHLEVDTEGRSVEDVTAQILARLPRLHSNHVV